MRLVMCYILIGYTISLIASVAVNRVIFRDTDIAEREQYDIFALVPVLNTAYAFIAWGLIIAGAVKSVIKSIRNL